MTVSSEVCRDLAKLIEVDRAALREWTQARADLPDDSDEVILASRYMEK